MSANDKEPEARKERYRRAVAFLDGARHLPELSSWQIDRIERHLNRPRPRRGGRPLWVPALAVLALVLLAGAALAVTGSGLGRVPIIGPLVAAIFRPAPAPVPHPGRRPDPAATVPPPATPPVTAAPAVAAPEEATRLAAAGAARAADPPRRRRSEATVAPAPEAPVRPEASAATTPPPERPTAPPATTASPSPAPAVAAAAHAVLPAPVPPATPEPAGGPAAAAESSIVAESRSFAAALARWHRDRDAGAALAALDVHEQRFPDGEIRLEAQLLRAEILLAGGRERDSLALLDPLALSSLPRARELRTVRGELRIKVGRCSDGKSDLGAVLAEGVGDALAQRARQALASCP